ncbi:hypothetical protein Poly21_16670 [Allorhodopirellula heiligendammensis]|uniref:Uncharacterized protein n=1 Tax=Allorhodopirellula heiligendammensis TaxID=2714739 RepID=A0A5C6C857_9BACT|nr:hypothetical protein Poly21_16670 [Allorhodopirellula heiligendammensis]
MLYSALRNIRLTTLTQPQHCLVRPLYRTGRLPGDRRLPLVLHSKFPCVLESIAMHAFEMTQGGSA